MNTHTSMNRSFDLSLRRVTAISAITAAAVFFCAAFFAPDARAYQIKRVLNGVYSVGTGTEVGTVPLGISDDPLDLEKSAVFFTSTSDSTDTSRYFTDIMTIIDDPETVQFARRATSTNAIYCAYSVVEFAEGVQVLSGMTTVAETVLTKVITLPDSVDLTKSFPIISWKPYTTTATNDERYVFRAEITDVNKLTITRGESGYNVDIAYQVIAFDTDDKDVHVQRGTCDIDNSGAGDAGETSDNGTVLVVPVSEVDLNKTMLFFTVEVNTGCAGYENRYMVDGRLSSSTALTFTRNTNTSSVKITWYLVECDNMFTSSVQRDRIAGITTATSSANLATSLWGTTTMPIVSFSGPAYNNTGGLAQIQWRGMFAAAAGTPAVYSTLNFNRYSGSTYSTDISWQAAEFPLLHITSPDGDESFSRVGDTINITWNHAKCLETGGTFGVETDKPVKVKLLLDQASGTGGYPLTIATGLSAKADLYAWHVDPTLKDGSLNDVSVIGNALRVRIECEEVYTTRNYDESNGDFEIKGDLTLVSPVGGETWLLTDTNRNISWKPWGNLSGTSGTDTVTISLSTDNGASWDVLATPVAGNADGDVTYNWPWNPIPSHIPSTTHNLIGSDNLIKIELTGDPTNVKVQGAAFTIKGAITGISLDPNRTLLLGEMVTINWTKKGHFGTDLAEGTVDIYYSSDGGYNYTLLNTAGGLQGTFPVPAGADPGSSVVWDIPASCPVSSPTSKLKVVQTTDPTVFYEMPGTFLVSPSLDVTAPVNSAYFFYGSSADIQWIPHGDLGQVVIKYSKDGGTSWTYLPGADPDDIPGVEGGTPEVTQSFTWQKADVGLDITLRVCKKGDEDNVYSEVTGLKVRPVISVDSPQAGETIEVTDSVELNKYTVAWHYTGEITGYADIYLTKGTDYNIAVDTGNTDINNGGNKNGTYQWTVVGPDHIGVTGLQVQWRTDSTAEGRDTIKGSNGESGAFTTIAYLRLLTPPNTSPTYTLAPADSDLDITWRASPNNFNVIISYSTDSGSNWTVITTKPAVDGAYAWPLTDSVPVSDTVRIKVEHQSNALVEDKNTADFKIVGSITLTGIANGGGSAWLLGEDAYVTWTTYGVIGNVDISYAHNGTNYSSVTTGYTCNSSNSWSHTWPALPTGTIPGDLSITGKIKIQPQTGSTPAAVSSGDITVKAKIFDVAPTSGSIVYVDDPDDETDFSTIAWKLRYYQNIPDDTKLILSYDPGTGSYTTINNNVLAPADTWSWSQWQVPNIVGDNIKVRVQSAAHPDDVLAVSSSAFKVRGKFGVLAPTAANVGESALKVHSTDLTSSFDIRVRNTGTMTATKIEYATDGSTFYDLTTVSGAAGVQTFSWNPPATWNGSSTIGTTNKLRFTDPGDASVPAKLSAAFEIKPQLALDDSSIATQYDIGGDPILVKWKYAGTFTVEIWFSSDLGANYTSMGTAPSTDGQFEFPVPNVPTVEGIIKITAVGHPTVYDNVPLITPFRVRGTILTVGVQNAPWKVSDQDTNKIVWTWSGAFANVILKLDVNNAMSYAKTITASTPNDGEFIWNILESDYPAVTYPGCRIRAIDANDPTVVKDMVDSFTIRPVVWITHPQGENWQVGASPNITWDYYGTISTVKIQYSEDGTTWPETSPHLIAASTGASAKSLPWTVPDTMSSNCVMRITSTADAAVTDDSDSAFGIKPKLAVDAPLGGAVRATGSLDIKWTTTGTLEPLGTVKLQYIVDGGEPIAITGAQSLASPDGVQQTHTWTIPDIASNNVQIRVVSNDDGNIIGTSNTFGIRKLSVLTPASATHWQAGKTNTIQWSSTGVSGNVQVSYSLNGTDWSAITPTDIVAASTGHVDWAISNTQLVDQSAYVKIVDVDNASTVNTISAAFDLMAYLEVTGPALGQDVTATLPVNITWNKAGSGVDNVLLEYTKNGTVWNYVKTDGDHLVPNTGSYSWTVPADALTATAQIRITDPGNANATHTGPVFQIYGAIDVTVPNGTQSWEVGTNQDIFWTITGNIANVEIFYSPTGADGTWASIGTTTGVDGADGWTWTNISPTLTLSKTAKIKVVDMTYTEVSDISTGNFELKGKISNVVVGSSILTYTGTSSTTISWTKSGEFATVDIALSLDGGSTYSVPIKSVASDASPTDWTIPNYIGNTLKVRVKDATVGSSVENYSSVFKIKGSIVINAPTAVTEWSVKSPHNVLWTPVGTYADTNVQISYSADGETWVPIISVEAGAHNVQQTYAWTPDGSYIGTNRYLKIATLFGDADIDVSATKSGFKLTGAVNLTYPDATGIIWNVGSDQTITWTASGLVTPVKIEYSTNNGGAWTELTSTHAGVDGANSYQWTSIPGSLNSEQCLIRVSDARTDFASVTDTSANAFSIRPVISISAPVSGQNIPASSSVPLRWSVTGSSITLVDLYYSVDNGGNWVLIEEDVPVAQGTTYNWSNTLTNKVNNQGKVRVIDSGNPQVIATMTGAFNIIGNLDLLTLKSAGASWEIGTEKTISWTYAAVTNVRGEYSLDGGTVWNTIENGTLGIVPASNLSMPWQIPDDTVVNQNAKIRIVDNENDQMTVSTSVFPLDLRASFLIDSPIDGATVYAGGTQVIQWDQDGTVPGGVILEYTTDGTNWNYVRTDGDHKVAGSYGVNIQYPWSVPAAALTSSGRVRIYDPNNASYKYQGGGAALWIKGIIFMLNDANHSPRGGESWSVGTAQEIKWTTQGTINKFLIYYAADGTNFALISPAASEEAVTASPWTWNIPTDATLSPNTGKIKVVKYDDATTTATSQGTFEVKGAIQNVRVAGVESGAILTYTGTSSTTITWEPYGSLTSVNIMLSTDGATFNTIDTVAATPATYNWTIPNAIGNTLKIKVKDAAVGSTVEGISNTFKIKGSMVIDEPTALTDWTVKSSHNILWTPVGTYTGKSVRLDYSTDGTNWTEIATVAAGAHNVQQSCPWTPAGTDIGTNRYVKITTLFGDADIDVSTTISGFKLSGAVVIGYPDASGIVWNIGTEYTITWNATGLVTPVKIEYSTNNGGAWTQLTDTHVGVDGANSYPWTIPGALNSEQCLIRVSDARSASFPLVTDTSANMFSIRPTITVSQPVAGQNVPASGTVPLRWSVTGTSITQVNLQYSVNNGIDWTTFDSGVAVGQGTTYNWTNTFTNKVANLAKVRVVDNDNDKVIGNCPGAFNIVGNLELLTLKDAGASWEIGTTQSISWNYTAVTNVKGEYSLDGGTSWTTIQNPTNGIVPASNGSMTWEIPNDTLICQTTQVRIVDNENQAITKSTSINPLDLRAKFAITEPINGATVYAEENQYIRWTPYGTVPGGVILEYTTDGTTWNYVNTDGDHKVTNNGEYLWAVPASALTSLGRVRMYDPDNASYKYTGGGGALSIKGQIFMLNDANHSPRGGESWSVGSAYQIKWTKKGAIAKYLIYYAADGTNFSLISPAASGEAVTASPWTWTIPTGTTLAPNTAKIRIDKYDDATTTATSNGVFEVKGAIANVAVASPVLTYTGDVTPTTTQISWEPYGQLVNVTILLSLDGGGTYPVTIDTVAASSSPYTWNVPNYIDNDLKIKVKDAAIGSTVEGVSSIFKIKGGIVIDEPTALTDWTVKSSHNILWTPVGTYTGKNVRIDYSADGTNWTEVATVAAGTHNSQRSYPWTPAGTDIGTNRYIKITTLFGDADIDVSTTISGFKLSGAVNMTYPDASSIVWNIGTEETIPWNATGLVTPVKIEYSTNNGTAWTELTSTHVGVDGANSYPWTIPGSLNSEQCLIRVSDARVAFPLVTDTSANMFSIRPAITISAPVSGDNVPASGTVPLRWSVTGSSITMVDLQYSVDNGSTWTPIEEDVPVGQGTTYTWTNGLTSKVTNLGKVRVVDSINDKVIGTMVGAFNVVGKLELITLKDTPENWVVGTTQNITWNYAAVTTVKAYYSHNGTDWIVVDNLTNGEAPASDGTMPWIIPGTQQVDNSVWIKIVDKEAPTVTLSTSIQNLALLAKYTIVHPRNGDILIAEDPYDKIEWTFLGEGVTQVLLEYSTNGKVSWNYVNPVDPYLVDNSGSYIWPVVPGTTLSDTCYMRVSDPNNALTTAVGDTSFRIKGYIAISRPTTGTENFSANTPESITWTKKGNIGNISVYYSYNEGLDGTWGAGPIGTNIPANNLTWTWNIPEDVTLTTKGRIKVTAMSDSTVTSTSANNFTIKGRVEVTSPNAGTESWAVGTGHAVTWDTFGAISEVDIYLSTTGGSAGGGYEVNPNVATQIQANLETYSWNIPASTAISKNCFIKVQDHSNASVWDESDAAFEIKGQVDLTYPDLSTTKWFYNEAAEIRWTPTGNFSQVLIEYSTDNFVTPVTIVQTDAGASGVPQTFNWGSVTIPCSDSVKIRITDPNSTTVTDQSSQAFAVRGRLTITVPNGPETWKVNTQQSISWATKGTIPNIKLYFSKDGGAYTAITGSIANSSPYPWTIPDQISDNVLVKITDAAHDTDTDVDDESDAAFKIIGNIVITSPVGALPEAWIVGSTQNITWNTNGTIPSVSIYYSDDGGSTYPYEITAGTSGGTGGISGTGSFEWTPIPNNPKTTCKVKIMQVGKEGTVFSISPQTFKIIGDILINPAQHNPKPGMEWIVEQQQKITWDLVGAIQNVKIELSTDSGANYDYQITASTPAGAKEFYWDVPDTKCSPTARIKISDVNDNTVFKTTTGDFKLQPQFTITNPVGGQVYTVADNCLITWTTDYGAVPDVRIEYSYDNGSNWTDIVPTMSNTGSKAWGIPDHISESVMVRISDVRDSSADYTTGAFKIRGNLALLTPATGSAFIVSSPMGITWNATGTMGVVTLQLSTNGGTSYDVPIAGNVPSGDESYGWTTPNNITNQAMVKVSLDADSTVYDETGLFYIRGALTVGRPNGPSDQFVVGTTENITWTRTGNIANVKIILSTDGGMTYPEGNVIIASYGAAGGSYPWPIPDQLATNLRVKVADASDENNVFDTSDANFGIRGSLSLTSPNLGGLYYVGDNADITWTKQGSIQFIAIEGSTNAFADESQVWTIASPVDATGDPAGSYKKTVPVENKIGTNLKIRIKDMSNPANVFDISDSPFTIKGKLKMLYPDTATTLYVDDPLEIQWQTTGTIALVQLRYSTDGGTSFPEGNTIVASTDGMLGSYTTTVPNAIEPDIRFRVMDITDMAMPDDSDQNIVIKGKLSLTSPITNVSWPVASNQNITWNYNGSIANVKIEYSVDGWGTSHEIVASTSCSAKTYQWTNIPDDISNSARVRISNVLDSTVSSTSPVNFKIVGVLEVTSPTAASRWEVGVPATINWNVTGSIANVRIDYSANNGGSWTNIVAQVAASAKTTSWTPTPESVSLQALIRVSDFSDSTVFDISDQFHVKARFTVSSPSGGLVWPVDTDHDIEWTTDGVVPTVRIDYCTDGVGADWKPIAVSTSNNSPYRWTVDDDISSTCKVKVSDTRDAEAFGVSAGLFKIRGDVQVLAPSDADISWIVGESHNITWDTTGTMPTVKIEYSINGGGAYTTLSASYDGTTGSMPWTVLDTLSTNCLVRISDTRDSTVYDVSNNAFTIRGSLAVDEPLSTAQWEVNSYVWVRWHRTAGNIQYVKIELSKDGGISYPVTVVASVTASLNQYNWQVTNDITNQAMIRISDTSNPAVIAESEVFKIKGKLTITRPNGDEVFVFNTSEAVNWTVDGSISTVRLDFTTNGTNFTNIVPSVTASLGTKAWTIPDALSDTVRVKISDNSDPDNVLDLSDGTFRIVGALTLLSPAGSEVWPVGSSQSVGWSRGGTINRVKIVYSINGGSSFDYTIAEEVPGGQGSVNFNVLDTISPNVIVKVYDLDQAGVSAQNATPLKIRGDLVLTRPVGGESWLINSSEQITWTRFGSITNAKLEYSLLAGQAGSWNNIATVPAL
ncbi:MAG: hypothetical protein PHE65_02345, partial [Candidatus Omnitrophica bacterium]|nr:hypothetical protein [Candidatus Omnitrophota bacterium]